MMHFGQLRRIYPNVLKLEIQNSKTSASSLNEENETSLEKIKGKSVLDLFCEFYKLQNNVELDDNSKKIIKEIIEDETNKIEN